MPADGPSAPPIDPAAGGVGSWSGSYLRARALEGRLYSDQLVADLPHVPSTHPLASEWRLRADNADRLVRCLRRMRVPPRVVDVGCGNGWLARAMAGVAGSQVVGLDRNGQELAQAARVFAAVPNLRFVPGDATVSECPLDRPTVVVLASVIQYVPDLGSLMARLLGWLGPGGELHILDSPLYSTAEIPGARARTRQHYERLGVAEMVDLYHHHEWSELDGFDFDVMYRPNGPVPWLKRRVLGRPQSPFPWLRIRVEPRPTPR